MSSTRREKRTPPGSREGLPAAGAGGGGGPVDEFFAALDRNWPDGRSASYARPRRATALKAGWTPQRLASFTGGNITGGNITGVRNPYAVLAARLSPAELPPSPVRPARPPWCGECGQATRMLSFDGAAPRPCPRCKPGRRAATDSARVRYAV